MKARLFLSVCLTALFLALGAHTAFADVVVSKFTIDPPNPQVGQPVTFTVDATSTSGTQLTYYWQHAFSHSGTFDQEGPSNTFTWTYDAAATYYPTVEIYDEDGSYNMKGQEVTVSPATNQAPIAKSGGPYSMYVGQNELSLWAGDSFDLDPGDKIVSYEWDLNNDGEYGPATGSPLFWLSWDFVGIYGFQLPADPATGAPSNTIRLRVIDSRGVASVVTTTISIYDQTNPACPPIAEAGSYDATAGVSVMLDGSASAPHASIVRYEWDTNLDGVYEYSSTSPYMTHSWSTAGTYYVRLRVTDAQGRTGTEVGDVNVAGANQAPTVDAGGPYSATVGQPVTVTATGSDPDGDTLTYSWDLDNNGTYETAGMSATKTWSASGSYVVAVKADDGKGGVATDTAQVTIASGNRAPVAEAGGPYTGNEGSPITFDGSASSDPDIGDTITCDWDFNGDGVYEVTNNAKPNHTYSNNGTYTAVLRVTDSHGAKSTDTATVTVNNLAPTISSLTVTPNPALVGQPVTCKVVATDPGGDALTYDWDFDWDVHGGNGFEVTNSTSSTASWTYTHTYAETIYVVVRVHDGDGAVNSKSVTVVVNGTNPPNIEAGGPYQGYQNQNITLHAVGSDSGGQTLAYAWDLNNDGTFETSGQDVQFLRSEPGTFTVKAKATNTSGLFSIDTATVSVVDRAPVAEAGGPYSGGENAAITFDGRASTDPDSGDSIVNYEWDLDGDGTFEVVNNATPSRSYPTAGARTVTLRVTDNHGASATDMATVNVGAVGTLLNGSFELDTNGDGMPDSWTSSGLVAGDGRSADYAKVGAYSLKITGDKTKTKSVSQQFSLSGEVKEELLFRGRNKTIESSSTCGNVGATLYLNNADGTKSSYSLPFAKGPHDWTTRALKISAAKKFTSATLVITYDKQVGRAYFDDFAVAKTSTLSNLAQNASFELDSNGDSIPDAWTPYLFAAGDGRSSTYALAGSYSLKIGGESGKNKSAKQHIVVSGSAGDTLLLRGSNKAVGSNSYGGAISAILYLNNSDGTKSTYTLNYSKSAHEWATNTVLLIAGKNYTSADIVVQSYNQTGSAYFDDLKVLR